MSKGDCFFAAILLAILCWGISSIYGSFVQHKKVEADLEKWNSFIAETTKMLSENKDLSVKLCDLNKVVIEQNKELRQNNEKLVIQNDQLRSYIETMNVKDKM